MAERAYGDMGTENLLNRLILRLISPGKSHCGGMRNPTGVDIFTACHKNTGDVFAGLEKMI